MADEDKDKEVYVYDKDQMALVPAKTDEERERGEVLETLPPSNPEQNIPDLQKPVKDGGKIDGPAHANPSALHPATPSNPSSAPPLPGTVPAKPPAPAPTPVPLKSGQSASPVASAQKAPGSDTNKFEPLNATKPAASQSTAAPKEDKSDANPGMGDSKDKK